MPAARRVLDALDPQRRLIAAFSVVSASLDDVFLSLTAAAEELARV